MQKIIDFFKRLKKNFVKQTEILMLVELAAIMLVLTLASNYLFNYSFEKLSSRKSINNWDYFYSNSPNDTFKSYKGEISSANKLTPMSREKTGAYLHMRTSVSAGENERIIRIKTDHAPIKVLVNGELIYDNGYKTTDYSGNTFNEFKIAASGIETKIEVSMHLPFSADIQTTVITGKNIKKDLGFNFGGGIIFSIIIFVLSLGVLGFSIFMKIKKKTGTMLTSVFVMLFLFGGAILLAGLLNNSNLFPFSSPRFYNASIALESLIIIFLTFTTVRVLKMNNRAVYTLLSIGTALVLLILIPTSALLYKLSLIASCVVTVIAIAIAINVSRKMLDRRIQYARGMLSMLFFLLMFDFVGTLMFNINPLRINFTYCKSVGIFIYICFMIFICIAKMFSNQDSENIQSKIELYDLSVKNVTDLMRDVLSKYTEEDIFITVADGILELCRSMEKENGEKPIALSVSVKENDTYREIYNLSSCGAINYNIVEHRAEIDDNRCLYGETYFDIIFPNEIENRAILHFENIVDGLDSFFISIMNTLFCCVTVALVRLSGNHRPGHDGSEIFLQLAHENEIITGSNRKHLGNVKFYTKTLLKALDYPEEVYDIVSNAAMLHDIGKIAIPLEITAKSSLLSEDERKIINKHTDYGFALLSVFENRFMQIAADIARDHHEKYNGTGNQGVSGEDINEYARIVTVADVIDALTAKRSYKEAWSFDATIEYINNNSGILFDPKVVDAMNESLDIIKTNITET